MQKCTPHTGRHILWKKLRCCTHTQGLQAEMKPMNCNVSDLVFFDFSILFYFLYLVEDGGCRYGSMYVFVLCMNRRILPFIHCLLLYILPLISMPMKNNAFCFPIIGLIGLWDNFNSGERCSACFAAYWRIFSRHL